MRSKAARSLTLSMLTQRSERPSPVFVPEFRDARVRDGGPVFAGQKIAAAGSYFDEATALTPVMWNAAREYAMRERPEMPGQKQFDTAKWYAIGPHYAPRNSSY